MLFLFLFFKKKSYFGSGILPMRQRNLPIEFLVMLPLPLSRGGGGRRASSGGRRRLWRRSSRTRIRGVARAGCSQWVHHSRLHAGRTWGCPSVGCMFNQSILDGRLVGHLRFWIWPFYASDTFGPHLTTNQPLH